MKKLVQFTTPFLMAFFLLLGFNSFGQGTETFENSEISQTGTSYVTGTFLGQDGSTWNYVQARGDKEITGKAIMLGKDRDPQSVLYSGTLTGGIGTLTFDYMQAFTSNVNLEVLVKDVVVGTFTTSAEAGTPKSSGAIEVNVVGDFVIKFANATGGGQVVIDNVTWTAFDGTVTKVSKPTISPNGGTFYEPVDVTLATTTEGATLYYSTTAIDGPWTEYTAPITLDADATIWAYAAATDLDDSDIATAAFEFPVITDVANIEALRAGTVGEAYRLTGKAVLHAKDGYKNRKFFGDDTAAIMIYDDEGVITTTYEIGDGVENITGVLGVYNNLLQLIPIKDPGAASSTGNAIEADVMTIGSLTADDQAKLVTLKNVTLDTALGNFQGGKNIILTDGTDTMQLRTDFWSADYIDTAIPTAPQNITGVILQYKENMQIVPRSLADFEEYVGYTVTFEVHMHAAQGFDPETDEVYITGSLLNWAAPGDNHDKQVMTVSENDPMVYTTTMELEQGTYEYKYFLNAGWDNGEWNGGDNRSIVLDETKTQVDVFGDSTNESLPVEQIEVTEVNLFPNPARDQMNIIAGEMINEVRVYDMLGQIVFSAAPQSQQMVMNVSNLKAGVYLVQVNTDRGTTTRRIQIQK